MHSASANPHITDALTADQLAAFHEHGFVRIRRAFAASDAAAMRDVLWSELERRFGAREDDPGSWRDAWSGLKPLGRYAAFRAIASPRLGGALDQLLGVGGWGWPRGWHMFLVNPPDAQPAPWSVPSHGWHWDAAPGPTAGVNAFVFYDRVAPRGGGTLLVAGSHRLIARFLARRREELAGLPLREVKARFARSHPWIARLTGQGGSRTARGLELTRPHRDPDGTVMRVAEMTGQAGDVILWHSWMHHVRPGQHRGRPRLMSNALIPVVPPGDLHRRAL